MTIYVIDDHPLMREAVVMLLRRQRAGADIVELDRLSGLAAAVSQHGEPELFCLDLKLPDTVGVSGVIELKTRYPKTPLAVISAAPADDVEEQCVDAGADIYIEKSSGAAEIGAALRALLVADSGFEELAPTDSKLSKRQKQLIVMLDQGLSNRDIAESLGISEHTVKVHLWRLFRRLGVKSRTQTVHYARTHGLL
ncbi:MAG: response regulator transcription factor [Burkholderiales bacterium]|jgi:DNA-binding NarL/FixJ family response regulator|nr:response regulator transcription factor [Burkholderiales bacterium]MDP2064722.1 response regulator transcription factor [Burkholderiaceae bacterium]MDZ4144563.1 response regulator transcription factor [Burkholderiales bacterium]PKO44275.1 MAG: DNA-binding response regulator [Betaproteobacteria bacterium HGW-Betaproteobacteria-3]